MISLAVCALLCLASSCVGFIVCLLAYARPKIAQAERKNLDLLTARYAVELTPEELSREVAL